MSQIPEITTSRLILRPFTLSDAPEVQKLAGRLEIADTTMNLPHPYPDGAAESWIGTHQKTWELGSGLTLAITLKDSGQVIGAIGLTINKDHNRAEMGYWVAVPHWGKGYCTEAARALLDYGFSGLKLNKIYATHLVRNPASGKVMQNIGMKYEGCLRQHVKKWDKFEDLAYYGVLKSEYKI
ncbi:GNAT family N-acetyltransferase [candidate division TA06 bacterium]|uniref:GNAT family N-acetyltransferase n=1 Tax=candidate division TA06 bacterium TaxID=2250710 RepID=A0A933IAM7_UNCT6|nr:GNAT family N-acetyltransferase [candidate division TA06 bacterium]